MIDLDRACKRLQQMVKSVADNVKKSFITQEYDLDKIGEYTEFIPEWTFGFHEANSVITYGGYYLQCITSHNAVDGGIGYNPLEGYAAMWRIYHSKTAEGAEPFLIRNSEDRYMVGDYCTEYGEVYMCIADNAVYPPSVSPESWKRYGVTVDDDAEPDPETPAISEWKAGETVKTGDLRTYSGKTYECVQGHTTQIGWEPLNLPALWKLVTT